MARRPAPDLSRLTDCLLYSSTADGDLDGVLLFVSELKQLSYVSLLGLLMVLCGECLRKAAMLTAGSNFNHIVQNEKAQSHVLVTGGVYSLFRHPSYVGWFYWSIGTQVGRLLLPTELQRCAEPLMFFCVKFHLLTFSLQVLLCNPLCVLCYSLASWRFFRERIEEEELSLIHFFGEDYVEYKQRVSTGLPFISGIRVN